MIDKEDVEHVAWLARLDLEEEEMERFTGQFADILEYFEVLDDVPDDVEPTYHVLGLQNVFREDRADRERMLTQEEALENAEEKEDGYFKGPRIG